MVNLLIANYMNSSMSSNIFTNYIYQLYFINHINWRHGIVVITNLQLHSISLNSNCFCGLWWRKSLAMVLTGNSDTFHHSTTLQKPFSSSLCIKWLINANIAIDEDSSKAETISDNNNKKWYNVKDTGKRIRNSNVSIFTKDLVDQKKEQITKSKTFKSSVFNKFYEV